MAQYTTITTSSPLIITDNIDQFLYAIVGDDLWLLQEDDGGYEDLETYECTGATGVWRVGVRDGYWVMDAATSETGFDGEENTDWENVEQHKLP